VQLLIRPFGKAYWMLRGCLQGTLERRRAYMPMGRSDSSALRKAVQLGESR
jgi:hypothetical protein